MPRKSKNSLNTIPPVVPVAVKSKRRGRPRKIVNPDVFEPLKKQDVTPVPPFENNAAKNTKAKRTNPATSDQIYSSDEVEFMNALAEFKRESGRVFPTCSEILHILHELGYRKSAIICRSH